MPPQPPTRTTAARPRAAVARVVAPAVLTVLGVLMGAVPVAWAQGSLVGSDPEDGSVLGPGIDRVQLIFGDPPRQGGSSATITQPDGEDVVVSDLDVAEEIVRIPLPEDGGPGEYLVRWEVVSSDGRPVEGALAFTILAEVPEGFPEPDAPSADGAADPSTGDASIEATTEATDDAPQDPAPEDPAPQDPAPEDPAPETATTDAEVGSGAEATSADTGEGGFPVLPVVLGVITLIGVTVLVLRSRGGEAGPSGDPGDPPTP